MENQGVRRSNIFTSDNSLEFRCEIVAVSSEKEIEWKETALFWEEQHMFLTMIFVF